MIIQRLTSCVKSLASIAILLALLPDASAQTGAVQHVHDACIIKAKDTNYIFSTGPGVPIRTSRDLLTWKTAGKVFEDVPAWTFKAVSGFKGTLWAPDISYFNDEYHLYYSVSTFGSQRSCIGLATNKTLDPRSKEYKWSDQGKVIESGAGDDWNAIDPNIILDEKGTPWLAFGSFWGGLKLTRLDPRTGMPADSTIHAIAARPGLGAIEAPCIVRKGEYYYLFASWDYCCKGVDSDYKVVVGRSKDVTGPYLDFRDKPMAEGGGTLVLAGYDSYRGPGHNAILMDGKKDWLIHHFYDAEHKGVPTLQVRPLFWGDDGWPLAGEPYTQIAPAREIKHQVPGDWEHALGFGAGDKITFAADGKLGEGPASWVLNGRILTLNWPNENAPMGAWVDRCILSDDGNSYVGRNQGGAMVRGKRVTDE